MNTEKLFKIILIFILVCGLVGCCCVKDKENFSAEDFDKSTLSGSYYYYVDGDGVEHLDKHNVDCNPEFNCKACVYHEESGDQANCISCNNDYTLDEMFDKGTDYATGICRNNVESSENVEEDNQEGPQEGSDEVGDKVDDKKTCTRDDDCIEGNTCKSDDDCTEGKFCKYFEDTGKRHCKISCKMRDDPVCPKGTMCVIINDSDPNEKKYCGPDINSFFR